MQWICKKFEALNVDELYSILQLRNEVFVVEQNCVFQDADDKDQASYHFMGFLDDRLVAYTRIVPAGISYEEISIGRVVTSPAVRGRGIGKLLMEETLHEAYRIFGNVPVRIGAQVYLEKFYTALGFTTTGKTYVEDGIDHMEMIRPC
jgi:ElaA protein